jgi:hypothetical protein
MPLFTTLLFSPNIVIISLESGNALIRPFKWDRDGIVYKLGKFKYHIAIRSQEIRHLMGKNLVDLGYPSGLPMNVQLAMAHPKMLEQTFEERVKVAYDRMVSLATSSSSVDVKNLTPDQKILYDKLLPFLTTVKETKLSKEQIQAIYSKVRADELEKFINETKPEQISTTEWYSYLGNYKNVAKEELYTRERENAAYWRGKKAGSDLMSKIMAFVMLIVGSGVGLFILIAALKAMGISI